MDDVIFEEFWETWGQTERSPHFPASLGCVGRRPTIPLKQKTLEWGTRSSLKARGHARAFAFLLASLSFSPPIGNRV